MEKFGIKNHITIPGFAVVELRLSGNELVCFSLIYGFCQDGESEFFGSISYMVSALNIDRSNVIRILNKLSNKGLIIKRAEKINGVKYCHYTINKEVVAKCNYQSQNNTGGSRKMQPGVVAKCDSGGGKMRHNNISNNINDNINDTIEAEVVENGDDLRYKKFIEWLTENAPHLLKLQKPFTKDEFLKLRAEHDAQTIMSLCLEMENYKDLTKKYTSANLTFRSWMKRRKENNNGNQKSSTREECINSIDTYLANKYSGLVGNHQDK